MGVTVEFTYDMARALGAGRVEIEGASSVADTLALARARFGERAAEFDRLSRLAAVAVNGVLVNYRRGLGTPVADGDLVSFVKASAGG